MWIETRVTIFKFPFWIRQDILFKSKTATLFFLLLTSKIEAYIFPMGDIDFYRKRVRNVTIDSKRSLMLLLNTHAKGKLNMQKIFLRFLTAPNANNILKHRHSTSINFRHRICKNLKIMAKVYQLEEGKNWREKLVTEASIGISVSSFRTSFTADIGNFNRRSRFH